MVLLAPVGDGGILLTRHRYPQLLNDERSKRTVAQRSHFKANRFNSNSQGWLRDRDSNPDTRLQRAMSYH